MGLNTPTPTSKTTLLNFVPLVGGMLVIHDKNLTLLREAREAAGATQTDTFQGKDENSVSGKAINYLKEHDVIPYSVSGVLTGISTTVTPLSNGDALKKVNVQITDGEDKYLLALDASNPGVQMLIGKLEGVAHGANVDVNVFSTYEKNKKHPEDPKLYTNHGATLKAEGVEAKIRPELIAEVRELETTVRANLEGKPGITKNVVLNAVKAAKTDFYMGVADKIAFKLDNMEIPARAVDPGVSELTGGAIDLNDYTHTDDYEQPKPAPTRPRSGLGGPGM